MRPSSAQPGKTDRVFKALRQFNCEKGRREAGLRHRLFPPWMSWFQGDTLPDKLARALAARAALDMKEFTEAFEFFERVRGRARAPVVADLCCGHGLGGLLFAIFERQVEQVLLVDRVRPPSHRLVFEAVCEVAPWVAGKVEYLETELQNAASALPLGATILGIHACGIRTDHCLDAALDLAGTVAVMPCCYKTARRDAPPALRQSLGRELSCDVHRTYRLERAGFEVIWTAIPRAISAMNRIIVASPRGSAPPDPSAGCRGARRRPAPR